MGGAGRVCQRGLAQHLFSHEHRIHQRRLARLGRFGRRGAPVIVEQPANQTSLLGAGASFTVEAYGWPALRYQWRQDGIDLPGTTGNSLALGTLTLAQAGAYCVVVSNVAGVVTSAVARLDLLANTALIPRGAVWRYFDRTNDLGTAWRSNTFSDAAWSSGPARLGFGGDGEVTKVASNKQWTTYFRRQFQVPDPALVTTLNARLTRDDGAVIYLNGAEVWRDNLPAGLITNATPATNNISGAAETTWLSKALSPADLVAGWNLLAAEIHQNNLTSSDIGFDFELTGTVRVPGQPALEIRTAGAVPALAWPAAAGFFAPWTTTNLISPVMWAPITNPVLLLNDHWLLPLPAATNGPRFFRLQWQ